MSIVRVGVTCGVNHMIILKTCKITHHFVTSYYSSSTWINLLNTVTYADVHLVLYLFHVVVSPICLNLSFPVSSAVNSAAG